jgi:hypothetical protein
MRFMILLFALFAGLALAALTTSVPPLPTTAKVEEPSSVETPLPLPGFPGCVKNVGELPEDPLRYQTTDARLMEDRVIVVLKRVRRLMLFSAGEIRLDRAGGTKPDCWQVALGYRDDGQDAGVFDKMMEGDRRTPEGWMRVSDRPWSSYYHALMIHYPTERHAKSALTRGSITQTQYLQIARAEKNGTVPPQDTSLGSNVLIHGGGSQEDWTWGCVALNNEDIDELRRALPKGMRTWVLILP